MMNRRKFNIFALSSAIFLALPRIKERSLASLDDFTKALGELSPDDFRQALFWSRAHMAILTIPKGEYEVCESTLKQLNFMGVIKKSTLGNRIYFHEELHINFAAQYSA